tara:strand:- start:181 stop:648 length:468 start_codon:yes stop_codon:yes gene_type:complete
MTFRELLKKTNHKEIFNHLYKEYYYKNIDDEVHEMARSYQKVMNELLQKPFAPNKEWEIKVRTTGDELDDICWHNIEEESDYGIDLTPWSEIIDAQIQEPFIFNINETAAHILYEITFYGFTEEKVLEERRSLEGQVDESVDMTEVKKIVQDLES